MALRTLISNYAHFNYWANAEIADWLKDVEPDLLVHPVASSFTSIDFTLQHILRTQKFWLAFVSCIDNSGFQWSVTEGKPRQTLTEIKEQSLTMRNAFKAFTENELLEVLHLDMPWAKNSRCRYDYMLHVINHSTFHRGQIITIARGLGITEGVPATDYNIFNCLNQA